MSMGAEYVDLDGDQGLVVGEHNLINSESARLFVFYNNLESHKKCGIGRESDQPGQRTSYRS
jgi:hypothetical protein